MINWQAATILDRESDNSSLLGGPKKQYVYIFGTRMWANAQPDGRPAEHRWRPLFNAAKFGWRPLLDAMQ